MTDLLTNAQIQAILDSHHLGKIRTLSEPKRGSVNWMRIVNDELVLRVDMLDLDNQPCRYHGEQLAYEALASVDVPCPTVIAVDDTRTLVPHDYSLMTRVAGTAIIDRWRDLSPKQQQQLGEEVGRHLAAMHSIELKGYGRLAELATGGLPTWFDRVWQLLMIDIETCLERQFITPQLADMAQHVLHKHHPLMDSITRPVLVHSDAQFENWLTDGEKVTALLDFEWAHSGDPVWDFIVDHKWEHECPTSKAHVYRGYQSVRPLPDDFQVRLDLYHFVWRFTDLVWYDDSGEADHFAEVMHQIHELLRKLDG